MWISMCADPLKALPPASITRRLIVADVTVEIGEPTLGSNALAHPLSFGVKEEPGGYLHYSKTRHLERLLAKPPVRAVYAERDRFPDFPAALHWALSNLRGKHRNADTGWEIALARSGIEKALSGAGHKEGLHIQAIGALAALIESAVLVESRPPRVADPNIKAIHRFYAAALVDHRVYRVKITVKELQGARNFYDQSLTLIQQSPAAGGALSRESEDNRPKPGEPVSRAAPISAAEGIAGPVDLRISIAELLIGAKYEDGTYVLNFHGDGVREQSSVGQYAAQNCRGPRRRSTYRAT
jgi:hypothetical protein